MVLKIAWSVDDVAPIPEHGLNRGGGNFKYLFELNKELGVKFTLFVIPNYKGNYDIRNYKNWCDWIKSLDFCEIANHGFYHWNPVRNDWLEFIGITKPQAEILLKNSTEAFSEMGIYPKILKIPGWEFESEFMDLFPKYGFKALADHFVSLKPIKLTNGFYRIPYTLSTENLHSSHYADTLVLHSHIATDGTNKNGFTEEHYQEVRKFLKNIIEKNKGNVKFVTFSELIE